MSTNFQSKKVLLENDHVLFESENNILIGTYNDLYVDLSAVQKIVSFRLEVQKGKHYLILIKLNKLKKITTEARNFLASEKGCEGIIAAAILINSSIGTMMANFFLRVNKPLVPTKLFTEEDEAKKWLRQYAE